MSLSTTQTLPRIIFVDGFNTVGKDYFIDKLQKALPCPVTITDPRVWLPTFQKDKRYWDFVYRTPEDNAAIYNAHLHHLRHLRENLDSEIYKGHALVTNRSFVSAVNYNFLPSHHAGRPIGGDNLVRQRYIDTYQSVLQSSFSDVPTLMVNLAQFHDTPPDISRVHTIEQVRKRMKERQSDVLINDFYLDYLIQAYQEPGEQVKSLYTHWENATSSDTQRIVDKYFSPQ